MRMPFSSQICAFFEVIREATLTIGSVIFLPWVTGNTTLEHVLYDNDPTGQSKWALDWVDAKVNELASVNVTVGI